jgi:hypothetical protein
MFSSSAKTRSVVLLPIPGEPTKISSLFLFGLYKSPCSIQDLISLTLLGATHKSVHDFGVYLSTHIIVVVVVVVVVDDESDVLFLVVFVSFKYDENDIRDLFREVNFPLLPISCRFRFSLTDAKFSDDDACLL